MCRLWAQGKGAEVRGSGMIIVHEHTRVGTGFNWAVLVMAHCPALNTGIVIVDGPRPNEPREG